MCSQLTHWFWDKMAAIFHTTFSNAFSWMKMYKFRLKFHWSLFPRIQLTIFQHWLRWWLGAVQATSHYLNQWWLLYWRIYALLGLNELRCFFCMKHICWLLAACKAPINMKLNSSCGNRVPNSMYITGTRHFRNTSCIFYGFSAGSYN